MSTAIPSMPTPAPEGLSEPQRIVNTFVAPSKTFEDIRRNTSWWLPFVLTSILATCLVITIDKKVGWDSVVRDLVASSQSFQQAAPEIQERQLRGMAAGYKYGGYASAVFILVFGLIEAAILMFVFNFIMEAAVPFKTALAIVFYGGLPFLISTILTIVSLMVGNPENFNFQNPVATNVGYFMDRGSTSKFLYVMASSLDIFVVWVVILLGMGFAMNSERKKLKTSTAIVTVAVLYLIWKLGLASLATIRG